MREIKFRLFDKRDRKMIYPSVTSIDTFILCFYDDSWQVEFDNSEDDKKYYGGETFEVMQFSGLKDKNGKEIFEGDIVKNHWYSCENNFIGDIWEVKFGEHSTSEDYYASQAYGFYYQNKQGEENSLCGLPSDEDRGGIEIIGNIYETPELLN